MRSRLCEVWQRISSVRARAALSLGVVACLTATGTLAYWTDTATISGTTLTSGTIDLKVNDQDDYATTTLSISAMVPGSKAAEVIPIKNAGTAPLKYSVSADLAGADPVAFDADGTLRLRIFTGPSMSVAAGQCQNGSEQTNSVLTNAPLEVLGTRPSSGLAPGDTESLCLQVGLDSTAASSLQGKSATLVLTVTGTSF